MHFSLTLHFTSWRANPHPPLGAQPSTPLSIRRRRRAAAVIYASRDAAAAAAVRCLFRPRLNCVLLCGRGASRRRVGRFFRCAESAESHCVDEISGSVERVLPPPPLPQLLPPSSGENSRYARIVLRVFSRYARPVAAPTGLRLLSRRTNVAIINVRILGIIQTLEVLGMFYSFFHIKKERERGEGEMNF